MAGDAAAGAGPVDQALIDRLYAGDTRLAQGARLLTELGGTAVLVPVTFVAALGAYLLHRDWRAPTWFVVMTLAGRLLVELQKAWTMRLRPDVHEQLAPITSFAFPSGHAANSTMVWLGAALLLARGPARRWWIAAAAVLAVAIGLSRPMLGVHWPSDVVAGWSLGLFWTLLLVKLSGTPPKDCSPASA